MTTQYQPTTATHLKDGDPGHQWFLNNYDEIMAGLREMDFLAQLKQVENENNLPAGTAERFATIYVDASSVPELEESRHIAAWDAYQESLNQDPHLATLARAYGEQVCMPIYDRINREGTFLF